MEKLLLYILEALVAEPECQIKRCETNGVFGPQWMVYFYDHIMFILDKNDVSMLYEYITKNPFCVDEIGWKRFQRLFNKTINSL